MKAWQLLSDPKNWCRGSMAKNSDGRSVVPGSPDAVQWCVLGAVAKCYESKKCRHLARSKIHQHASKKHNGQQDIVVLNDVKLTHEQIVDLLKAADV